MAAFNSIVPSKLMRLIGTDPDLVLIDLRLPEDFADHTGVIPTSFCHRHEKISDLASELVGKTAVLICHKGLKISHGAAALLRAQGINAVVLEGGMTGWRVCDLPTIPTAAIHKTWTGGPTRWVTRHRPKIDRIACPGLIRRFVDPRAEFLFVPASQVMDVAQRFDAIAFDTPEAPWTHQPSKCTFDAMVEGFGLNVPALIHMARVIRAADTGMSQAEPEAAGLLALSVGLSRVHKNDLSQMEAGFVLYDALFRWARDGTSETHSWPEHQTT